MSSLPTATRTPAADPHDAGQPRRRAIYEAPDGVAALDAIRTVSPDVMILNWDMPVLDGPEVMRIVRSPDVFPKPNLPIIMLTDLGLRSRVHDAIRLGVHEFLVKPISPKTLQQRLMGIDAQAAADGALGQLLHPDAAPPRRPEGRADRRRRQPQPVAEGDDRQLPTTRPIAVASPPGGRRPCPVCQRAMPRRPDGIFTN